VHPLDDPVGRALAGPHAGLALRAGRAARYPAEVSPFAAVSALDPVAFEDLARLVPESGVVALVAPDRDPAAPHWRVVAVFELIQMVCERDIARPERAPAELGAADVDDMIALVAATEPGPFGSRTLEMGRYFGFREGGRLVAMAGERLHPPGYTEVSGVCTALEARGRGLAESVVREVAAGIQERGEIPFLHVRAGSPSESTAVALYERIGFRERRRAPLAILQRGGGDPS
jgi:predicted GNAT family acetyltransferase